MQTNRRGFLLGGAAAAAGISGLVGPVLPAASAARAPGLVDGILWQVHESTMGLYGEWELIGAHTLMLQWMVVDGRSFVPGLGLPTVVDPPNWKRIVREPWAKTIIAGLASYSNEPKARAEVEKLAELSASLAKKKLPFRPSAYYFPVESDPTWQEVGRMTKALEGLPRPLWVSAYDNSNVGPEPFAEWVLGWLPKDVGLMFQDGLGLHMRTAEGARTYGQVLRDRLGPDRFTMIAEAFRPGLNGTLRAATAAEMGPQLLAYQGFRVLVFDGPNYLSRNLIYALRREYAPQLQGKRK